MIGMNDSVTKLGLTVDDRNKQCCYQNREIED